MDTNKENFRISNPDPRTLAKIYNLMYLLQTRIGKSLTSKWEGSELSVDFDSGNFTEELLNLPDICWPLLWTHDYPQMRYTRRLARNFLDTEIYPGQIFLIVDYTSIEGHYFLYMVTETESFDTVWAEYLQGGCIRPVICSSDILESVCRMFPWSSRLGMTVQGDIIQLSVRTVCHSEYEYKILNCIPGSSLIRTDLGVILQHDDSGVGLIQILQNRYPQIQTIIPIIGSSLVYTDIPISIDIPEIPPSNGDEPYTGESYSEMDPFWRSSLILGPCKLPLSPTGVWKGFQYGDPYRCGPFSPDLLNQLASLEKISPWLNGFRSDTPEIQLKTIHYDGFDWIYFIFPEPETPRLFWKIPHLDDQVYGLTYEILTKGLSSGALFKEPRYYWTDPLLLLTPEVLDVIEESLSQPYPDSIADRTQRLCHDTLALARVLK